MLDVEMTGPVETTAPVATSRVGTNRSATDRPGGGGGGIEGWIVVRADIGRCACIAGFGWNATGSKRQHYSHTINMLCGDTPHTLYRWRHASIPSNLEEVDQISRRCCSIEELTIAIC